MSSIHTFIDIVRQKTPLSVRQSIGPILARLNYYANKINPFYKRPSVYSIEETIQKVIFDNLSVIRFGDGEIAMMDGASIGFQKNNPILVSKMKEVIRYRDPKLLICIPGIWKDLSVFKPHAYAFNMHHIYRHGHVWKELLSDSESYGDTNMTRPYLAYKDISRTPHIFNLLKQIWENKDIILIEGSKTRIGIGNDLLANALSVKRLLCPAEHAFDSYDQILFEALKLPRTSLILLSLGPTAKVLALDLFKAGFRVVDIGHIDMEYEMYIRKEPLLTVVPHKYFNEVNARNPVECMDPVYLSQIISTIK